MQTPDIVFCHNSCPCGSDESRILFRAADYNFRVTTAVAAILRCELCGSFYPERFPSPATLGAAYVNYYTAKPARRQGMMSRLLNAIREDYLGREAPAEGTILDYGCGSGAYLNQRAHVSPSADLYGSDVYPGTNKGAFTWIRMEALAGRHFRHITLSHVLEHVPDPAALFGELANLLENDGTLWIATPNADSFLIDIFGAHSRDVDFPRHRAVLSRIQLERLANDAGLRVTWRTSPLLNTIINGVHSARNFWHDPSATWRTRAAMIRRAASGALKWAVLPSVRRQHRTPETVAVCRKAPALTA